MTTNSNVLAFVNYKVFRKSSKYRARYKKAYWYVSKKPRIVKLTGKGGTLWVVTSYLKSRKKRVYSLAYKLVNCRPITDWTTVPKDFGEYGIEATDYNQSKHFSKNNITKVLRSLEFSPKRPIKSNKSIGLSLLNARLLSDDDVNNLESYADKVINGKTIFISYSSKDSSYADSIEESMLSKGHGVFRDVRDIVGGEKWVPAIIDAINRCDCFLLLVSDNSADSSWVKFEVKRAKEIHDKQDRLNLLMPVVLSSGALKEFPEVHEFQKRTWEGTSDLQFKQFCDKLADELKRKIKKRI